LAKSTEDRYGWASPRRFATAIASVRLRTFSLVKMLRKCPFTVAGVGLKALALPVALSLLALAMGLGVKLDVTN